MSTRDLAFACNCGTLHGVLTGVGPGNGNRIDCSCKDCRAAVVFAAPDGTPVPEGPVRLYQSTPSRVRIDGGAAELAVFSLSPKGLLRWHAKCCGAMLFNTVRNPKLSFAAVFLDRVPEAAALGPVRTQANLPQPDGTSRHKGIHHAVLSLLRNALPARLTGSWKQTPFFDPDTLTATRDIYVLTPDERSAATA